MLLQTQASVDSAIEQLFIFSCFLFITVHDMQIYMFGNVNV